MRIAQLMETLGVGGAEKLQVTLAAAARERDVELTVINLMLQKNQALQEQIRAQGARIIEVPARRLLDWRAIRNLAQVLRRERFDVLQTHLAYANIMGAMAGRMAGIPVVSTLHSAALHPRYHPMVHRLEAWALRYGCQRVVAVGHMVANAHQTRLGKQPITVIPNAVASAPSLTAAERHKLRHELCGDSSRPLLISVGRLTEVKGYFDLLEAFAILREQGTPLAHAAAGGQPASSAMPQANPALLIVGSGHLYDQLAEKIETLGLSDHAWLLGLRHDVPRLLAASDLYVSASHWEGLPLSVLEAMMAGLPIVATKVGDLPKVVVDGTGILVEPKSPPDLATGLQHFLHHPTRMQTYGAAAQEYATRHHTVEAWFNQLLTLYKEVKNK
ncbi:MAG: glycosyltransferase [Ardenticatenaceae bacterium]